MIPKLSGSYSFNLKLKPPHIHPSIQPCPALHHPKHSEPRNMTTITHSVPRLQSPFLCCPLKVSSASHSRKVYTNQNRPPVSYPCIRALDLDSNTIVAISVGIASVAVGIGIPVFYESQINNAATRENDQPCFPCNGTGAQKCRFCLGVGTVTVELGGGANEVSPCINCDNAGSLTCTSYLDRREFKDDD